MKVLMSITFVIVFLILNTSAQIPENGLTAYWLIDDNNSTINDATLNNNDGSLNGSVSWGSPGRRTSDILKFNGMDGYINCGNDSSLNPLNAETVSMWVKPLSGYGESYPRLISQGDNARHYSYINASNGKLTVCFATSGGTAEAVSNSTIPENIWTHITYSYDGNNVKIYINGLLDNTGTKVSGTINSTSSSFCIGSNQAGDRAFYGYIDTVSVYDRALKGNEITRKFWAESSICYLKFSEGPGSSATDLSGLNNSGALNNMGANCWLEDEGLGFDGNDDYVSCSNNLIINQADAQSFVMWIKPYAAYGETYPRLVSHDDYNRHYSFIDALTGKLTVRFATSGGIAQASSNYIFPLYTWSHVAYIYDGSNVKIYINGQLDTVGATVIGTINSASTDLCLGSNYTGSRAFRGVIDSLVVFNKALDEYQVERIYNDQPHTQGDDLQACWLINENSSLIHDSSGKDNEAVICGGASWNNSGRRGVAVLNFNGDDGYLDCGNDSSLNPDKAETISLWIKPEAGYGESYPRLISHGESERHYSYINAATGKLTVCFTTSAGTAQANSNLPIPVGVWTNIAYSYDGNNVKIYINGLLDSTGSAIEGSIASASSRFCIGSNISTDRAFNGMIDTVSVYKKALSEDEIKQKYWSESSIASWCFNNGSGGSNNDLSGFGNAAFLYNFETNLCWKEDLGVKFDGVDDYIDCGNSSILNPVNSQTIAMWIKPESGYGELYPRLISHGDSARHYSYINAATGKLTVCFATSAGSAEASTISAISPDIWTHVAYTYDGSNVKIYINGRLDVTGATLSGTLNQTTEKFCIGSNRSGSRAFNGIIDSIKVYGDSLDENEIELLYVHSYNFDYLKRISPGADSFEVRFIPSQNFFFIEKVICPDIFSEIAPKYFKIKIIDQNQNLIASEIFNFTGTTLKNQKIENVYLEDNKYYKVYGEILDSNNAVLCTLKGQYTINFEDLLSGRYVDSNGNEQNTSLPWVTPFSIGIDRFFNTNYNTNGFESFSWTGLDGIPPGFDSISYSNGKVTLWGREYKFDSHVFPQQIVAAQTEPTIGNENENILAAPVNLTTVVNGVSISCSPLINSTQTATNNIILNGTATAGNMTVAVSNKISFDGVMEINMALSSNSNITVNSLKLEVPFNTLQAQLFHDMTDVVYRKPDVDRNAGTLPQIAGSTSNLLWSSANPITPDSGTSSSNLSGTFRPYIWLGNEDRGLCWFADSDRNWSLDNTSPAITVEKNATDTIRTLTVNFINKDIELTPENPIEITFGLLATPVKQRMTNWRGSVFVRWATIDNTHYNSLQNLRKFIMVGAGDPHFNSGMSSLLPQDLVETQDMYNNVRDSKGSTYFEYWCSDFLTLNIEPWKKYFSEWINPLQKGICYRYYPGFSKQSCNWLPVNRTVESLKRYKGWCLDKKLQDVGEFAYYEDNSHPRIFYDRAWNLGYDLSAETYQPQFDIFSYRDYIHKLASVYQNRNSENLLGVHSSCSMHIPSFTCAQFYIDGEEPARYDKYPDKDYIDLWPLDYIRAHVMGRQFGINSIFLSEMTFDGDDTEGARTRALIALMVPHDIAIWDGAMKNRQPLKVWHGIKNDFNFYGNSSRMYPYWSTGTNTAATASPETDVLVTVWKIDSQLLVMVSNLADNSRTFNITFYPSNMGFSGISTNNCYEAENNTGVIIINNELMNITIPRHDYKVFRITAIP